MEDRKIIILGGEQKTPSNKNRRGLYLPNIKYGKWGGYVPMITETKKIKVRQADKQGYTECNVGGVVDLNYVSSTTRRGRCIKGGQISPTLTAENTPSVIELGDPDFYNFIYEIDGEEYLIRIRKLIPLETWRLMGFSDEDFHNAEEVNSNTQLYKQAGNSIVVNCLVAIFGQMFEGKEDFYKEMPNIRKDNKWVQNL